MTSFAISSDGTRIAYDVLGTEQGTTPLVLLHGGWVEDRRAWHERGYVEKLLGLGGFQLLVIDARGHGESDRPTTIEAYGVSRVCDDVIAVLDREQITKPAAVWGWSYGASVGLQLASLPRYAHRIDRVALGGAIFGQWLTNEVVEPMVKDLERLASAKEEGTLDDIEMHRVKKDFLRNADIGVAKAACQAMLHWPVVSPEGVRCPALLYYGSKYLYALSALEPYAERVERVGLRRAILDGLDHRGEFDAMEIALPPCVEFLRASRNAIALNPVARLRATIHAGSMPAIVEMFGEDEASTITDEQRDLLRLIVYVRAHGGQYDSERLAAGDDPFETGLLARTIAEVNAIVERAIKNRIFVRRVRPVVGKEAATRSLVSTQRSLADLHRELAAMGASSSTPLCDEIASKLDALRADLDQLSAKVIEARNARIAEQSNKLGIHSTDTRGLFVNIGGSFESRPPWIAVGYPPSDISIDLHVPLPLPSSSCRFVYSAHTLEHVAFPGDALRLLREIHRVLEPNGYVRIVVPNIASYMKAYCDGNRDFFRERTDAMMTPRIANAYRDLFPHMTDLFQVLAYAGAASHATSTTAAAAHQFGYDLTTLSALLTSAGFVDVVERSFETSAFPELADADSTSSFAQTEYAGVANSLFVEARKSGATP